MGVRLNTKYLSSYVREEEFKNIFPHVAVAHEMLHKRQGAGSDYLGWLTLPEDYDKEEFTRIKKAAAKIQENSDVLLVVGIGGSYLGARAVIEAVQSSYYNATCKGTPQVYFTGNSVSPSNLADIIALCDGKEVAVNVISKSGTTTETAIEFRLLKDLLEERYGKAGARERIFVTTDKEHGVLKGLAAREGYETFSVPDDIGGRFSVLTSVGLLPIAVAGVDIDALMAGAQDAMRAYAVCDENNGCYRYAMARNILYRKGKEIEFLTCFEPDFMMMNEWFKQLFGESEGKDQKGLFPASAIFTTDLHSMGQYIQDGARILFETIVNVATPRKDVLITESEDDIDGLNFLAGVTLNEVNHKALLGTVVAHSEGGVPVLLLEVDSLCARDVGHLIYFFEKACAISGYLLGVNPFDQPGVEDYKRNMFALLGKPGYEQRRAELEAMLAAQG